METVSVIGCEQYDIAVLEEVMERHFQAVDPQNTLIKPGDRVAIKPNLVIGRRPEDASTTHPEFVAAIIRAVKRRGGVPVIAESPGGPFTKTNLRMVYTASGIEQMAAREGAELNYDVTYEEVPAKNGKKCSSFAIIRALRTADVVISAAKLKTHSMMLYSGAVKNMFGAVPGLMKPEFHFRFPQKPDFAEMIVDLCETVRPAVAFLDGIDGMEGDGPTGGTPIHAGVTFASCNPYTLDLLAADLIGMKPEEVPVTAAAAARGLCPAAVRELSVSGDDCEAFRAPFKMPKTQTNEFLVNLHLPDFLRVPLTRLFTPKPVIVRSTCVGCGKCAESCPQKTITIENRKAVIDYSRCIKCFCCHEMCPVKSVRIRKFRLFSH